MDMPFHPYSIETTRPLMRVMVQVEEAVAAAQSAAAANIGRMDEAAQKAAQAAQDVSQAQQRIEAEKIAEAERVARAASPILDEDEVSVALEALGAFVGHPITKEDDKEVARVLQDYGSWEDERVAKVVADLVAHRKSERERRKREFFASKRGAEQGGGPSSAASTSADETSSYDAAAAAGPDGEEDPEQFKARLAMVAAIKSADHTTMQAALDGAQAYQDGPLAEQFEQLQTRLQEVCPTAHPPALVYLSRWWFFSTPAEVFSLDSSNTTTVLPSC
eukprot:COSAG05_NODE_312_length_11626_cov_9.515485_8_plen_277_part_00